MKKITFFLIVFSLLFFVSSQAVIAGDECYNGFRGVYEMIARGNALISTTGFTETDEGFIPNPDAHVWGTIDMAHGTWTFKRNGTGTAEGRNYAYDLPPGHPVHGPRARDNDFYFEFEYTVSRKGVINAWVTYPEGPLKELVMEGMISRDRKTITLHSEYIFFNPNTIFMASRVLIRVKGK